MVIKFSNLICWAYVDIQPSAFVSEWHYSLPEEIVIERAKEIWNCDLCELNSLFAHFNIFSFPPHNLFFYIGSIQHCVVMQIQFASFGVMLQVLFPGIQQVGNKYLKPHIKLLFLFFFSFTAFFTTFAWSNIVKIEWKK